MGIDLLGQSIFFLCFFLFVFVSSVWKSDGYQAILIVPTYDSNILRVTKNIRFFWLDPIQQEYYPLYLFGVIDIHDQFELEQDRY